MWCCITTVEGRRWDCPEPDEIPIQVGGDNGYKPHPIVQHQLPPPPLLPPPPIPQNPPLFSGLPPPHFLQRPPPTTQVLPPPLHPPALLPPPLIPPPPLNIPSLSGPLSTYNTRPPQRQGYNTLEPGILRYPTPSHTTWVTTSDRGTNSTVRNDWGLSREREWDLERNQNQITNMNSKNGGRRYVYYGRDSDHQRKHHRSREHSWDQEDRPRGEHRQKDREDSYRHKSSRRKTDSEEQESHKRHKRKKSKRGKEEKNCDDGRRESRD
ncbi:hypothetical protein GDO86_015279 [Hymenochirus boettgeri]|uniref:Uncharacterized protein n=1 Tax=Hymenochirus boettgeri TaxID=247094 RepID=A0A8T2K0E8_9PIPI|nr:hypothetical protein GDO86_015279 [Hymenochirus boettgeri]